MASCFDYFQTPVLRIAPGALLDLKMLTFGYGHKYLILMDCGPVTDWVKRDLTYSFERTLAENAREFTNPVGCRGDAHTSLPHTNMDHVALEYKFLDVGSMEVTFEHAQGIAEKIKNYGADVVVACGGGKCFDIMRSAMFYIDTYFRPRCVIIPTQLASNACSTNAAVIYNETGTEMLDIWTMKFYVDAVIVDSELIANSSPRLMAAGIGDQMSVYENYYNLKNAGVLHEVDQVGLGHLKTCMQVLHDNAVGAVEAVRQKKVTRELENVLSCVSFMSGPFYSLAGGFMEDMIDEALIEIDTCRKNLMHGERVGYGALPQFVYMKELDLLYEYVDIYRQIGLPVTLDDLGIGDISYDELFEVCKKGTNKLIATLCLVKFDAKEMTDTIFRTDALVKEYLAKKEVE